MGGVCIISRCTGIRRMEGVLAICKARAGNCSVVPSFLVWGFFGVAMGELEAFDMVGFGLHGPVVTDAVKSAGFQGRHCSYR